MKRNYLNLFVLGILVVSTAWCSVAETTRVSKDDRALAEASAAILRADYRGDRVELARQATALAAVPSRGTARFREYWTGFAWWRRGINGFNETPVPGDLKADFERCATHERAALALDPDFGDAQGALAGCLIGQMYAPGPQPDDARRALAAELTAVMKAVRERSQGNPRSLWMVGGSQAFAPPPHGGDPQKAESTYHEGLAAARAESLRAGGRAPWEPSWGAPELLMSLAFLHGTGASPNRALARAYAVGALALVPDWHYVRDILLPRIEALPEAQAPSESPSASRGAVPSPQ